MHKNTYINSPKVLNSDFSLKGNRNIFFAGQLTGVEGYVESAASGLLCGINMYKYLQKESSISLDNTTVLGALSNYIARENADFQPMNANFGILDPIGVTGKDKALKKQKLAERAISKIKEIKETI